MADSLPNVKNYHLASLVQDDKLTLLFQLKPAAMTKSFGIEVADIAQLPKKIVNNAKKYLKELEDDIPENADETKVAEIDDFFEKIKSDKSFNVTAALDSLIC
jgi:DNA mismatch repair ATPase MutS